MWDVVAFIIDFVVSSTPGRAILVLIPASILGGLAFWAIPNQTVGSWVFAGMIVLGLTLAIWWHFKDQKHDQQA